MLVSFTAPTYTIPFFLILYSVRIVCLISTVGYSMFSLGFTLGILIRSPCGMKAGPNPSCMPFLALEGWLVILAGVSPGLELMSDWCSDSFRST